MRYKILVLVIMIFSCGQAFSFGLNPIDFGVRSVAMGGTSLASANDASAIYSNPALLTNVRSKTFNGSFRSGGDKFGFSRIYDDEFIGQNEENSGSYSKTFLGLDMMGFVYPEERSTTETSFGLSLRTEYQNEIQSSSSKQFIVGCQCLSFGSGMKLTKNLLVGFNINLRLGSEFDDQEKYEYKGQNLGFGLGIVFPDYPTILPQTVGITYSTSYRMEMDYPDGQTIGDGFPIGRITLPKLLISEIPSQFGLGAEWKLDNLTVAIDTKMLRYSVLNFYSKDVYHFFAGIEHAREFEKSTFFTRAGFAQKDLYLDLPNPVILYLDLPNPVIVNSSTLSAGIGLEHNLITYDIAISYSISDQEKPNNIIFPHIGTEKTDLNEFRIMMGLKIISKY
jgi:hypothetical protein